MVWEDHLTNYRKATSLRSRKEVDASLKEAEINLKKITRNNKICNSKEPV